MYLSDIILADITRIGITPLHEFYCPALKLAPSAAGQSESKGEGRGEGEGGTFFLLHFEPVVSGAVASAVRPANPAGPVHPLEPPHTVWHGEPPLSDSAKD